MKYYEIIETLIKVDEQSIISAVNKNGVNVNNEYYNTFISHNLIRMKLKEQILFIMMVIGRMKVILGIYETWY